MAIDKYLDIIASQHKTKPRFKSWLTVALTKVDDGIISSNSIGPSFDLDNAVGVQLDILGVIVGRSRKLSFQPTGGAEPVLNDTNYRIALKAKIAQNQWDGTIPQIYNLWSNLFPNNGISIVDNQNMTMSAIIAGTFDPVITQMITAGYIIPKPVGVSLQILDVTTIGFNEYVGTVVSENDIIILSAG